MKLKNRTIIIVLVLFNFVFTLNGQSQEKYSYPKDSLVLKNLEKWRDLKFGIIMHWGLYAQIGVVESWGLCSEDQSFQDRNGMNYTDYKEMYFGLIKKFNPQNFDPGKWADAAQKAGMKYMVFTTKHHDGFCMFDTRQTDFKITGKDCPFHDNPESNIAKYVFEAFRNKGFMTGAYFSKPDWHNPSYWTPLLATPNRNNNYDIRKYPERWKDFRDFTFNQINELTSDYDKLDILWLDGGWVRPDSTINDEVRSWGYDIPKWEQDINMPRIVQMARRNQPGILIVDRTVHGPYEDYRTPEQSVPDTALPYPWESNMTMTQSWGYNFKPEYKSTDFIIHTLIDVVSKGGNFLLNVAPTPDGTFEDEALKRLKEIGEWMNVNGEGIYATRHWECFGEGKNIRFTKSKDGKYLYVFAMEWPGATIQIKSLKTNKGLNTVMLGSKSKIRTDVKNGVFTLRIPEGLQSPGSRPSKYAWVFKISLK
jgi:alpha-L-fucosidase